MWSIQIVGYQIVLLVFRTEGGRIGLRVKSFLGNRMKLHAVVCFLQSFKLVWLDTQNL